MALSFVGRLAGRPVLCIHAPTTAADTETIVSFVRGQKRQVDAEAATKVVFIDTPPTAALVSAVAALVAAGFQVHLRDHHDFEGPPCTGRDFELRENIAALRSLLGERAVIRTRQASPSCALLVSPGEFALPEAVLVVDADADGWLGAMQAIGLTYPGLIEDAACLDGHPALWLSGTPWSQLLAKGLYSVTPDGDDPLAYTREMPLLFEQFAAATQGDLAAHDALKARLPSWQAAVELADRLAAAAQEVAPGAWLVDTVGAGRYDNGRLLSVLESRPDCRVTVYRSQKGMVAALFGVQYMIDVAPREQKTLNVHTLLPDGITASSPELGAFSNTSFRLQLSEQMWPSVLAKLRRHLTCG